MSQKYHLRESEECNELINQRQIIYSPLHIRITLSHNLIRKQETYLPISRVTEKKHCKIFLKARSLHKFHERDKSPHLRSRLSPRRVRRRWNGPFWRFSRCQTQREKGEEERERERVDGNQMSAR